MVSSLKLRNMEDVVKYVGNKTRKQINNLVEKATLRIFQSNSRIISSRRLPSMTSNLVTFSLRLMKKFLKAVVNLYVDKT